MPIYEYQCQDCEELVTLIRSMSDESKPECPDCGQSNLKRQVSMISVMKSGADRARDVSWVDRNLAGRLRKKSKGKLSPHFKETLGRMESKY